MYTKQAKKMLAFDILEILKGHTDVNHRLNQKQIVQLLKDEYDMTVDRKSIRRNIMDLMDMGYDIQFEEKLRILQNPKTGETEEQYTMTDFYIQNEFEDCEVRLLVDEVMSLDFIPEYQKRGLIRKLEKLSSCSFRRNSYEPNRTEEGRNHNNQIFYNLALIEEAIQHQQEINFEYPAEVTTDCSTGTCTYAVQPVRTAIKDNEYFLVCKDNARKTFRMDLITDMRIA